MFGFLNIWKPVGPSSYDVIRRVRRCVGRKVKVGHAGTLDPLAEGVLVVCIGKATRLAGVVQSWPKRYITLARLGAVSTTDDAEGEITETDPSSAPPAGQVEQVIEQFVGTIQQVPPAFSAAKVAGQRAYKLARAGKNPDLAAKEVTVYSLEIIEYNYPHLRLAVNCAGGTYIRSLVRDIGSELGVGGYCEKIIRESIGPFKTDRAVKIDDINADNIGRLLIDPIEAVPSAARITVTDAQVRELIHGRPVADPRPAAGTHLPDLPLFGAIDSAGRVIGLLRPDPESGQLRPIRIFIEQ